MLNFFLDKISGKSLPRVTHTEIVCGDCGGDELLPKRTNLTTTGACAVCGGRSFVPASPLAQALAQHLLKKPTKIEGRQNYEKLTNSETTGNSYEFIN